MLSTVEQARLHVSQNTSASRKSQLGQFFTPASTASFMANLFPDMGGDCRLLDAGAGIGSLSAAFLEQWKSQGFHFRSVRLDAFEIDATLHPHLRETLARYDGERFLGTIREEDFIHDSIERLTSLFTRPTPGYTHAILNPPYKKIASDSEYRLALRRAGIETVNLYSAFVALAVALLVPGGQLVAIIPRSFCNGPYYRSFRDFILEHAALRHLHLFQSRDKAFEDDDVLQENVILRLERGGMQGSVVVSTSTDDRFVDLIEHEHSFERIVSPKDPERFIHVPTSPEQNAIEALPGVRYTLADVGVQVSTGPVVDFRLKSHLRDAPGPDTVPLLYPGHLSDDGVAWPLANSKKPNAIVHNPETEKWFYPNGFYCAVRRFSSKEEKRRVVARVIDPRAFDNVRFLGFENHLNLFHEHRRGLSPALAHGLAAFLNTTAVDESFRRFNGHTQVNATDLKQIRYPSREVLIEFGEWAMQRGHLTQDMIDKRLGNLTA